MSYCVGLYPTTSELVALACGHSQHFDHAERLLQKAAAPRDSQTADSL